MLRALALSAVVAAALAVPAAPSYAGGSCGSAPATLGVTQDVVDPTDTVDWWTYSSGVPAQYLVTLTPTELGDVDLAVYDAGCGFECESNQPMRSPDLCLVSAPTGVLNIKAFRVGGGPWGQPYVLTVTPVLPTFE